MAECLLPKQDVGSSNLLTRSKIGLNITAGFRISPINCKWKVKILCDAFISPRLLDPIITNHDFEITVGRAANLAINN